MTRVDCVGTLTCSRPSLLRRSLEAHVSARRAANRAHEIVVVDDARDPADASAAEAVVNDVGSSDELGVRYIDRRARVRFAEGLTSELRGERIPHEIVAFALLGRDGCGPTPGSSRNMLALHAAGDVVFASDDDVVTDLWLPRGARIERAPRLVTSSDPRDLWSFADRAAAICHVASSPKNAVLAIEELLGAAVDYGSAMGRVAVASFGRVGDGGVDSPAQALSQHGASRTRLMASTASYRAACASREVFRAAPAPSITDAPIFDGIAAGYDLRGLLPPSVPCGRGIDEPFGVMLRRIDRSALFGHLPWAVLHDPPSRRQPVRADVRRARTTVGAVIAALVTQSPSPAGAMPAARLASIGAALVDASGSTPGAFRERLIAAQRGAAATSVGRLERLLSIHRGEPAEWSADVRGHIEAVRSSIATGACAVPAELAHLGDIEAVARLRRLVRDYGELVTAWPAIVDAARRVRGAKHVYESGTHLRAAPPAADTHLGARRG